MKVDIQYLHSGVLIPRYIEKRTSFNLVAHNFQAYYSPSEQEPDRGGQKYTDLQYYKKLFYDIDPDGRLLVGCGYKLAIPEGYELQMRTTSALSLKAGLIMANGVDVLDSTCREEVCMILLNTSAFGIRVYLGNTLGEATLVATNKIEFTRVGKLGLLQDESVRLMAKKLDPNDYKTEGG